VRRLILAAGVALAALPVAGPAQAQLAVQCVNCSTIWNQLLEYGKQVQQLATQLQSYETQLQQYANMVTNTLALPQQLWGQVQSDIMQVRNLSNAASLLSGNAGSIVTRLQSASAYANQAANLGNIADQLTTWQQMIGNSVDTLGRTPSRRAARICLPRCSSIRRARRARCRRSRPAMSWSTRPRRSSSKSRRH